MQYAVYKFVTDVISVILPTPTRWLWPYFDDLFNSLYYPQLQLIAKYLPIIRDLFVFYCLMID